MRIQFKTEGGIAHLPGLSKPVTIDTDELPVEEAKELDEAARFFELPATSTPPRGAADYQQYTITVTTPDRSHTVRLAEPIEDPRVRELVNHLRAKALKAHLASRRHDTS
jgi:hypothetical protein